MDTVLAASRKLFSVTRNGFACSTNDGLLVESRMLLNVVHELLNGAVKVDLVRTNLAPEVHWRNGVALGLEDIGSGGTIIDRESNSSNLCVIRRKVIE